jgi:hypothetical protein
MWHAALLNLVYFFTKHVAFHNGLIAEFGESNLLFCDLYVDCDNGVPYRQIIALG